MREVCSEGESDTVNGELAPQELEMIKNKISRDRVRKYKEKMTGVGCLVKKVLEHDLSRHIPTTH